MSKRNSGLGRYPRAESALRKQDGDHAAWLRWLLLGLILLAFGRLVWQLDLKTLWWDESLSLQRAESGLRDLLFGNLPITDGQNTVLTIDQHPFTFFLLLGGLIRLAGIDEFVLRFPSVMAGTLLAPTVWVMGRRLARQGIMPRGGAIWATLLAAVSPFFLWYGQEARPYALWAWLGLLTTYMLLRWADEEDGQPAWLWAYGLLLPSFLFSHYFSVLLLPIHALLIYSRVAVRRPKLALFLFGLGLTVAAGLGAVGGWWLLSQPGAGSNFTTVSLSVMAKDMLNAYSMGPSAEITRFWRVDLLCAGLGVVGLIWGMRRWRLIRLGGWLLPAYVLTPALALYGVNLFQPAYMNARHLGLIAPAFLLLVGGGLGVLGEIVRDRTGVRGLGSGISLLLAGIILLGMGISTVSYFTDPAYRKGGRMDQVGDLLRREMQPGDLLLVNPAFAWSLFEYYLPLNEISATQARTGNDWRVVPFVGADLWPRTIAFLDETARAYRRIWLVTDGTFAYLDPEQAVGAHLQETAFRVWEGDYFSPTSYLTVDLFLPAPPISDELPPSLLAGPSTSALFGEQILLRGVEVGERFSSQSVVPITLYWDPIAPIEKRYKYVLELTVADGPNAGTILARTEREPYNGFLPTLWWRPGPIIHEYSELMIDSASAEALESSLTYDLRLTLYDAESLEKLAVTQELPALLGHSAGPGRVDGQTLIVPIMLPPSGGQ